jgi:large subunit ribosomal protein L6
MSRIGKKPIEVPAGVKVAVKAGSVNVEGPKGTLKMKHRPEVKVKWTRARSRHVTSRAKDELGRRGQGATGAPPAPSSAT